VPIPALFPTSATPLSPTDSASSPTSTPTSIPEASPILTPESLAHILPILASKGTSYWFSAPVEEFLPPSLQNDGKTYVKGTDTMDVWFDSGSAWAQLPERDGGVKPRADVVLEGSDQHRGWFQSLLLTCVGSEVAEGKEKSKVVAPYGTVITHGFVLDEKKEKMSKSDGNVTSPVEIIEGNPKARGVVHSPSPSLRCAFTVKADGFFGLQLLSSGQVSEPMLFAPGSPLQTTRAPRLLETTFSSTPRTDLFATVVCSSSLWETSDQRRRTSRTSAGRILASYVFTPFFHSRQAEATRRKLMARLLPSHLL
jgi:hypothetical protein